MSCQHRFVRTGKVYYTCPLSAEHRCQDCGEIEHRDEGPGIEVLTGLQAFRMRPKLYGLTQEQADTMKCAEVHEMFGDLPWNRECRDGWVHHQHPLKPPGVVMSISRCEYCNYDGRFDLDMPSTGWSVLYPES